MPSLVFIKATTSATGITASSPWLSSRFREEHACGSNDPLVQRGLVKRERTAAQWPAFPSAVYLSHHSPVGHCADKKGVNIFSVTNPPPGMPAVGDPRCLPSAVSSGCISPPLGTHSDNDPRNIRAPTSLLNIGKWPPTRPSANTHSRGTPPQRVQQTFTTLIQFPIRPSIPRFCSNSRFRQLQGNTLRPGGIAAQYAISQINTRADVTLARWHTGNDNAFSRHNRSLYNFLKRLFLYRFDKRPGHPDGPTVVFITFIRIALQLCTCFA